MEETGVAEGPGRERMSRKSALLAAIGIHQILRMDCGDLTMLWKDDDVISKRNSKPEREQGRKNYICFLHLDAFIV